ncbi:hypothetical protein [Halocatena salina]|uniref:Uncharacterized protein n=1 Tax=Halocatena salina TaxID=2934340 RepID=A0A8U0A5W6_9EURY|nr:hypothetical protein [Halocatena salina]UPM43307.1 hypothetical protein MW046_02395 [Halocatena salina]
MTRTFRTALTAILLVTLIAGGAGTAAAEQTDINSGETTVVNDNDLVELDNVLNNISTNVLGVQVDDSNVIILSALDNDQVDEQDDAQQRSERTEINSGETTVVNDDDLVDVDDTANNISTNVLGVQVDDTNVHVLSG